MHAAVSAGYPADSGTAVPDRLAAAPFGVDWDGLARPVAPDAPAGPSLRYEGTYDAVAQARAADDPSLPQGIWQTELRRADWGRVALLCHEALVGRSKDLQLGAWLLEALIHEDGFAGAATGLRVLVALIEGFWEQLHPLPDFAADAEPDPEADPEADGNGLEARMAPLAWVAAKLPDALRAVPLTDPTPLDARRYTMADWIEAAFAANRQRRAPRKGSREERDDKAGQDTIRQALGMVAPGVVAARRAALGDALDALSTLDDRLDALAGAEAPSLGRLRQEIEAIVRLLNEVHPMSEPRSAAPPAAPRQDALPESAPAAPCAPAAGPPPALEGLGSIETREQAYAVLDAVADHLLRLEPHSPAPYLVKRAVGWSRLSLAELLAEFMQQDGNLERLLYLLGIGEQGDRPGERR